MTDSNTIEHENETPKEASADRAGDLQNEEAAQNAAEERAQVGENPRDKAGSHAEKIVTKSAFLQMGFVVLGLLCVMLVVLNLVFSNVTTARWDLTTDKQFTLSPATVELLSSLDAKIAVKFFLSPNLPAPDNGLHQRAKDLLSEFEAASHGKFSFEIVEPQSATDEEVAKGFGLRKVAVSQRDESQRSLRLVFKGMTVIYRDRAETTPEIRATDNLEYLLAKSIVNLTAPEKKTVGILTDFGGLAQSPILVDSMRDVFSEVFGQRVAVAGVRVDETCSIALPATKQGDSASGNAGGGPIELDALVLLNLDKTLTPCAQYAIEQASLGGTSIAILQSPSHGDYRQPDQPRINVDVGMNELLKNTGLSLAQTLLLDRAHNLTGTQFTEDDAVDVSLPALPIITTLDKSHPMTQNLTALVLPFSGTIDVDKSKIAPSAKLDILAQSDGDAVTRPSGGDIDVTALGRPRNDEVEGPHVVAVALQTPLASQFKGKLPNGAIESAFIEKTDNARFFIVSNGEFLFINKITGYSDAYAKLGIHLFVNATEWLIQDDALMKIRNRSLPQMIQKPDTTTQNRLIRINVIGVPAIVLFLMVLLRIARVRHVRGLKKRYAESEKKV